jgi:Ca2+-transporting ATPase
MADSTTDPSTWYAQTPEAVATHFNVNPSQGLSASEAQQRLQQYGPNVLAGKKKEPGWRSFLRQYKDFMQIILVAAAVINYVAVKDLRTTVMLLILTVFNAVMSLRQESKAEASLAALEKMMKNIARVRRDGQAIEIEAEQLVPGDIVLMEAGNRVPADGRLFVTATLEIEEAALTGESVASSKDAETIDKAEVPLGDRHNMAFMNTSVTRGRGEMIVTTTGMGTEMGHIADLLNKTEADKTPLQKQLDRLTIYIAGIAGIAFILMVIIGLRNATAAGQSLDTAFQALFLAGIALAISAIPTGMPAVVTTLYSMGTQVLAKQNAIVKRLPSVETLGSVSAICSDKTGTLTLNKMTAVELSLPGQNRYKVTGEGYSTQGQLLHAGGAKLDLDAVMLPMALCADARLDGEALIGDPTEGALIVLAEKGGISVEAARQQYPRIAEVPFDSDYKFMATFHNMTDAQGKPVVRAFVKGAPDVLIARGGSFWMPEGPGGQITDDYRALALKENDRMAAAGERVMVVARRDFDPATFDPKGKLLDLMQDLTLLAMVGIVDPPRAEARDAIAKCHSAGIQVRMITGDHAVTAAAIGKQLGITGKALTGAAVQGHERRTTAQGTAGDRRRGARGAGGQDSPGRSAPASREHRGHDRRRRQRCACAQEGRHRRGDGHHRHGGLQRRGSDDPDRRQLRHHCQGRGIWPQHLRQPGQVHPLPDDGARGLHRFLPGRRLLRDCRRRALHALGRPLDQLPGAGADCDCAGL